MGRLTKPLPQNSGLMRVSFHAAARNSESNRQSGGPFGRTSNSGYMTRIRLMCARVKGTAGFVHRILPWWAESRHKDVFDEGDAENDAHHQNPNHDQCCCHLNG